MIHDTEPEGTGALAVYPAHEAAALFPLLSDAEMESLAADIRDRGLLNPIMLHDGEILDGRNRATACALAGVNPWYTEWKDPGCGPTAWVVSQNLHRRHLSASQRAVISLDALPLFEAEAKRRQRAHGDTAPGRTVRQLVAEVSGKSADQAAATFKVNHAYVSDAKAIATNAPDMLPAIRAGKTTITQAKRVIKERDREARREKNRDRIQSADVRDQKLARFATITLDPPWDWGDEGDADQFGRARPTYGTMSYEQLLDLPVPEWADTDCHLYLWITNRSLPKGFALLDRWGFRYITCMTWCKPSIGMGNYFRGSTEQVLFAVKGSQPLKRKDVGTWFAAPRPGRHSAKPETFAEIVETCSPGPYLEVFARSNRDGWTATGAEV